MANKDVFDEKMDALAESINAKAGTSGALTLDGMKSAVDAIELGSNVIANPTLEGGEDDLTSIEIDGTKYAVPSGGSTLYLHIIELYFSTKWRCSLNYVSSQAEAYTAQTFAGELDSRGFTVSADKYYPAIGHENLNPIIGVQENRGAIVLDEYDSTTGSPTTSGVGGVTFRDTVIQL